MIDYGKWAYGAEIGLQSNPTKEGWMLCEGLRQLNERRWEAMTLSDCGYVRFQLYDRPVAADLFAACLVSVHKVQS